MAQYYCTIGRLSDDELLAMIKKVYSKAGLLRELGLRPVGGNYQTINKLLKRLQPDISHWTGQGWSIGRQHKDLEEYTTPARVKVHVADTHGYKCKECGINEWRGKEITLELEHIDGDRFNNNPSNVCLLCPNCHSQTATWRRRKDC